MEKSLKQKWWSWHNENPHVWELFKRFTFQAINAGYKRYSSRVIIERIRWHTEIETKGDQFKMCNNHTPYYARYFHHCYPEHDGFFKIKELTSEKSVDLEQP